MQGLEVRHSESRDPANGDVLFIEPLGRLDAKTALDLEHYAQKLLEHRYAIVVVDLAAVEYLSSAAIRVLLLIAKRLKATNGELVLCSLRATVREVFEISGLLNVFRVTAGRQQALGTRAAAPAGDRPSPGDRQAALAAELLAVLRRGDPRAVARPPKRRPAPPAASPSPPPARLGAELAAVSGGTGAGAPPAATENPPALQRVAGVAGEVLRGALEGLGDLAKAAQKKIRR